MAETGWCYGVTFRSSYPVEPARRQAVMQILVSVGCPLFTFSCVSWLKAQVGPCALFLTRAQHKRVTFADSTISPGMWHLVAISHGEVFTNKDLSLCFLQKAGISLTYEPQGPNQTIHMARHNLGLWLPLCEDVTNSSPNQAVCVKNVSEE